MTFEIVVFTNDKNLWLIPGFQYLFNKYWSEDIPVTVAGYTNPSAFGVFLEHNFSFYSIDETNYPANKWSNGIIRFLKDRSEKFFVFMLEDYWINLPVNLTCIDAMTRYMRRYGDRVLRLDLSADRASNNRAIKKQTYEGYELISTPPNSKYQMSFQAAIWNRKLLLEVLQPNENPWESEINGTKRLRNRHDLDVLGTKVRPVPYAPVYRTHRQRLDLGSLLPEDYECVSELTNRKP